MGNVFHKKTLKEQMRENKRMITRSIRELDRERNNLEKQQKKLEADIKKMAKQGQMKAVRVMAKDLVRTKNYITKFYEMRSQLSAVALRLEVVRSQEAMTTAMKGITKAMVRMNKQVDVPGLQKIMMDFARENEKSEMMNEMMADAMEDVMDADGEGEEEEEKIVQQVLDELGVAATEMVPEAPGMDIEGARVSVAGPTAVGVGGGGPNTPPPPPGGGGGGDGGGGGGNAAVSDLEARLNNLRRN